MGVNKKLFKGILVLAAIVLLAVLLKPFIAALAFAGVFAYLTYPLFQILNKKLPRKVSAGILTAVLILVTVSFVAWGINLLINEFSNISASMSNISFDFQNYEIGQTLSSLVESLLSKFVTGLSEFISSIPQILISFFIFFSAYFYFLVDGKRIWAWIKISLPIEKSQKNLILKDIELYAHTFIYVWILIAIAQGIVAEIGFIIFDLPYPLLAGIVASLLSLIPIIGPYLLYIPVGVFLGLTGNIPLAIGIVLYGIGIGSVLDYILRPYFTSKWAAIHPLVVILGIFGGLITLGAAGLIIGPVLLLISLALISGISKRRKNEI